MFKYLFFIFFGMCFLNLTAQTDTIPKHYELKGQAYIQADSILDVWMDTQYPVILKKNKLKMTCAHCTNIFIDVVFEIGSNGRIDDWHTVTSNKCGEKFSVEFTIDFLIFFENFIFPRSLRNLTFQYRFGTGLKC